MARKKEFDPDGALTRAMHVFWRRGYLNTSLELLLREMGIAKQSLYDTFGDKRSLYLKALARYREQTNSGMRQFLRGQASVRQGFTKLLSNLALETREQHQRGCLLLSANLERDASDAAIVVFLRDNQAEVEAIFTEALRRAKKQGELSKSQDPGAVARYFVATIQGMRAIARLKSDRKALQQIANVALSVFNK